MHFRWQREDGSRHLENMLPEIAVKNVWSLMPDMEVVDNASDENNENTRRKATVVPIKIEYV